MLWVYGHNKYVPSYSAGIDFRRQILTSKVDPRAVRAWCKCTTCNSKTDHGPVCFCNLSGFIDTLIRDSNHLSVSFILLDALLTQNIISIHVSYSVKWMGGNGFFLLHNAKYSVRYVFSCFSLSARMS